MFVHFFFIINPEWSQLWNRILKNFPMINTDLDWACIMNFGNIFFGSVFNVFKIGEQNQALVKLLLCFNFLESFWG